MANVRLRNSRACRTGAPSGVRRGSWSKNLASRSSSYRKVSGSCHSSGPSLSPSSQTPESKNFFSGSSASASRFMWVMNRLPLTANTKPSGVWSRHLR